MSNILDEFFLLFLHIHHCIQEIQSVRKFHSWPKRHTSTAGLNSNKA